MRNRIALATIMLALALAGCNSQPGAAQDENLAIAFGGRPLSTTLSGAAEVPGPGDPDGSGTASITLNHGLGEICYELDVANIAPATAAHIHVGAAGAFGGVVVTLSAPTEGHSRGCVSATRELIKAIIQNPESYYINVHNAEFRPGALRGQLSK